MKHHDGRGEVVVAAAQQVHRAKALPTDHHATIEIEDGAVRRVVPVAAARTVVRDDASAVTAATTVADR